MTFSTLMHVSLFCGYVPFAKVEEMASASEELALTNCCQGLPYLSICLAVRFGTRYDAVCAIITFN